MTLRTSVSTRPKPDPTTVIVLPPSADAVVAFVTVGCPKTATDPSKLAVAPPANATMVFVFPGTRLEALMDVQRNSEEDTCTVFPAAHTAPPIVRDCMSVAWLPRPDPATAKL